MRENEFEQLRPWMDGEVTDAGYKPPLGLVSKGWLRHEFDAFYVLTEKGRAAVAAHRGERVAS